MVRYKHVMNKLLEETKQYVELDYAYQFYNKHLFDGRLEGCLITLNRQKNTAGYLAYKKFVNDDPEIKQKFIHELCINPDYFYCRAEETLQTLVHEQCHLWKFMFGSKEGRKCYHDKEWAAKMESIGLMPSHNGQPGGKKTGQKMEDYIIPGGTFETITAELLKERQIILFKYFPIWEQSFIVPPVLEEKEDGTQVLISANLPEVPTVGSFITQQGLTIKVKDFDEDGNVIIPSGLEFEPDGKDLFVKIPQASKNSISKVKYRCYNCDINIWGKPGLKVICGECKQPFSEYNQGYV